MADKKPKKKISREIKKDIKKAVDILPELVSDNHEFIKPKIREGKTVIKKKKYKQLKPPDKDTKPKRKRNNF